MNRRFDPNVIIEAQDRKIRSCATVGRSAPASWYRALSLAHDIRRVVEWCERRGIAVQVDDLDGEGGLWCAATSTIQLESRAPTRSKLITLLHECGHALIDRSPSRASRHRYGSAHGALLVGASPMDKVNIVSCEIEAWKRGWALAERLCLTLPKCQYEKQCVAAVRSYASWLNSRRRKL